ncbi:TonB-dependent receptor [Salisaeta longa]|uniref:TonB-dependent receptor n=1 Tax=Salisaeta longa TaxID=503170 RepID=UPI0003B62258|nr:TonB-dependent receptor [Salisaeta longa]
MTHLIATAKRSRFAYSLALFACIFSLLGLPPTANAQQPGTLTGVVRDAATGDPLVGANVQLAATPRGAATGTNGRFTMARVPTGRYTVRVRYVGYQPAARSLSIRAGDTTRIALALRPRTVGIDVVTITAQRGATTPQTQLTEAEIREANPRGVGNLMRQLQGVSAVRRGPVGLDPVVRGLRGPQLGVYVDGMRTFPAGPARMDSPLSHSDPATIKQIEVVKGPYALTLGSGSMSAVRVSTSGLWQGPPAPLSGQVHTGYDTNRNAYEATATAAGHAKQWAYRVNGAWRDGGAYETGSGTRVPAAFQSREATAHVGYRWSERSQLELSGGYNRQDDVRYPGRLLNATFFESGRGQLRYSYDAARGLVRSVKAQAYAYQTLHAMNNEGKPTFESINFPGPPLRITVNADITTVGGRVATELAPTPTLRLTLGGDAYQALRDAERPFQVVMNGQRMTPPFYESDQVWPGVTMTDVGVFAQAKQLMGSVEATASVRTDVVWAGADESQVSDVFLDIANTTRAALDQQEVNVSGALMLSAPLADAWTAALSGGTAVRTASALERYADRFPSNKAQTSAEFIGDPTLDPERSWQVDAELTGRYARAAVQLSAFARRIDNYITLAPAPGVAPMLPLPIFAAGPFRYVNGTATFYGGEARLQYALSRALDVHGTASYLWGRNETTDQPAFGIAPFRSSLGLRYEPPAGRFFVEGTVTGVAAQDRVALALGESPTDGYMTADVTGGVTVWQARGGAAAVRLQAGISNLTDAAYVDHLNASNPYTGQQVPEPGRVFFADVTYRF